MNLGELPFLDMMYTNKVAGVELHTGIMCLNAVGWFESEEVIETIERDCEELITHETIHAVLNNVIGLGRSPEWDIIDDDPNYIISTNGVTIIEKN